MLVLQPVNFNPKEKNPMPIKIEGLCGITVKNNALYALLPNFKLQQPSHDTQGILYPHYPAVLLQYDALTDTSKQEIKYTIHKPHPREYGLVLPNQEEIRFTFANGSPNLQVGNASLDFVEMKEVHQDNRSQITLHSDLVDTNVSLQNIYTRHQIDLASRVLINKGSLTSEEPTIDEYSFPVVL
ncbi:MAG: hypothetical protein IPK14_25260 [Blastocatellia bacterium]|nr:hypothetical protein [Blastocatellia bacterium]